MNEQAEQVLTDMIQRALDGVDAAVDFSQAQIPEVVEQLLLWKLLESSIFSTIGLLLCVVSAYLLVGIPAAIRRARKDRASGKEWTKLHPGSEITSATYDIVSRGLHRAAMAFIMASTGLSFTNLDWLQILIAPKLYLLEYAAGLVK